MQPTMATVHKPRLTYIDWMRGVACLFMFQTHCYDSWLSPQARRGHFFYWSQLGGTIPAISFLFLAGISFALVTERMREKGATSPQIARQTILRGAEIFGYGLLFRLQEFLLGWGWAPKTDLLRVDVLNIIGLSMMLMGVVCYFTAGSGSIISQRRNNLAAGVLVALSVALLSPLIWTVWRPRFLPWPLESYINGVHIYNEPQPWLFPLFPWAGFAFAGLAAGFALRSAWAREHETDTLFSAGLAGALLILFANAVEAGPQFYPVHDFWHTSPSFFLIRVGILLITLALGYGWCRFGARARGFSPLVLLGQNSLLVYWIHIEFVYGKFSFLPKHGSTIGMATFGLAVIFFSMLLLSWLRARMRGSFASMWQRLRPAPAALD